MWTRRPPRGKRLSEGHYADALTSSDEEEEAQHLDSADGSEITNSEEEPNEDDNEDDVGSDGSDYGAHAELSSDDAWDAISVASTDDGEWFGQDSQEPEESVHLAQDPQIPEGEERSRQETDMENNPGVESPRKRECTSTGSNAELGSDLPSPRKKLALQPLGNLARSPTRGAMDINSLEDVPLSSKLTESTDKPLTEQAIQTSSVELPPATRPQGTIMDHGSNRTYMAYSGSASGDIVRDFLKEHGWRESQFRCDVLTTKPGTCVWILKEGLYISAPRACGVDDCKELLKPYSSEETDLVDGVFMSILASHSAAHKTGGISSQHQLVAYLVKSDEHANCDDPGSKHHTGGCQLGGESSDDLEALHEFILESVHPANVILEPRKPFVEALALAQQQATSGMPIADDFCSTCGTFHPTLMFLHRNKWFRLCFWFTGISRDRSTVRKHPVHIEIQGEDNVNIQGCDILRPCTNCCGMRPHSHWIRKSKNKGKRGKLRFDFSTCNVVSEKNTANNKAKELGLPPKDDGRQAEQREEQLMCSYCISYFLKSEIEDHRKACKPKY